MQSIIYSILIYPIIYILPAYVANGAPVLFGGGRPIDGNKKLFGKPIFGKHKTIRGLIAGLLAGFVFAAIEGLFLPYMLAIGIFESVGTHVGDLLGSFVKRRLDIQPGTGVAILDQYTFLFFAVFLALPFGHLPDIYGLVFIVVFTGILHKLTNVGAYLLRLKKVPW
ncbi:MAG: CDP-2,3-bis-(O-geranylgeranyl)-sn-glycerol synthase [Candidatus Micrarchaeaceae archaeon]